MRFVAPILAALAMTGCATGYEHYAAAHKAQAEAQAARYAALAKIAEMGDTTAKVAAVISLNGGGTEQHAQIAAPKSWADYTLQTVGMFLPVVGQVYTINKQTALGLRQSDNATALGVAQATANKDVALGTAAAFGNLASSGFASNAAIAGKIQAPQPNITISGGGVIGSGTLTNNTMTSSTGVLGTGSYSTDYRPSTSTSTSTSSILTCDTGPC